jgi:hypothetical protein
MVTPPVGMLDAVKHKACPENIKGKAEFVIDMVIVNMVTLVDRCG